MVYLLLDCDEYLAAQQIAEYKAALGDPELADLNITEVDGAKTTAGDLLGQASMMPFLSPRRLVIARDALAQLDKRMAQSKDSHAAAYHDAARLLTGLATLPDTTDLVLVESGLDKRRGLWRGFSVAVKRADGEAEQRVPGVQALIKEKQIELVELHAPEARNLPNWINQRARARQIAIDGRAVQLLATYVGVNLRQLDNELEKLSLYASGRPISPADVNLLVSDASEAMIWSLTDALSQRNPRAAMQSLQTLRRNDANAFYLLTMIARQYRIILKVKEAMSSTGGGGSEFDIAKQVSEKPYPVKKAMQQALGYTFDELIGVLDRLLTADYAMKTGADPEAELDMLIAQLTQRRSSQDQSINRQVNRQTVRQRSPQGGVQAA